MNASIWQPEHEDLGASWWSAQRLPTLSNPQRQEGTDEEEEDGIFLPSQATEYKYYLDYKNDVVIGHLFNCKSQKTIERVFKRTRKMYIFVDKLWF